MRITYQSKTHPSSLRHTIPKYLRSRLIYKLSSSCCNATYCGETERHLLVRAPEHLGITPRTKKRVENPK